MEVTPRYDHLRLPLERHNAAKRFDTLRRCDGLLELLGIRVRHRVMALRAHRRRTGFLPPAVLAVGEYLDLTGDVVDAFLRERVDVHQLVALLVHEHDVE